MRVTYDLHARANALKQAINMAVVALGDHVSMAILALFQRVSKSQTDIDRRLSHVEGEVAIVPAPGVLERAYHEPQCQRSRFSRRASTQALEDRSTHPKSDNRGQRKLDRCLY